MTRLVIICVAATSYISSAAAIYGGNDDPKLPKFLGRFSDHVKDGVALQRRKLGPNERDCLSGLGDAAGRICLVIEALDMMLRIGIHVDSTTNRRETALLIAEYVENVRNECLTQTANCNVVLAASHEQVVLNEAQSLRTDIRAFLDALPSLVTDRFRLDKNE